MWKQVKNTISHAFFPARCAYCQEVVAKGQTVCSSCYPKLSFIDKSCLSCGYSTQDCRCKKQKHEYVAFTAPFYYNGSPQRAVKSLKFYNHGYVAVEMARCIGTKVRADFEGVRFDFVTGVPLSKRGYTKRGFNQAGLIAKCVGEILHIPYDGHLLKKVYDTEPQHDLPAARRQGNVIGAYDISSIDLIDGKIILLIDDVLTTGATINECARTLRAYGAAKVYCAAFTVAKRENKAKKEK